MVSAIFSAISCSKQAGETGSPNSASVATNSATFSCFDVAQNPWMSSYDINQDGYFGEDDLAARVYSSFSGVRIPFLTSTASQLNADCLTAKIGMTSDEVAWKLKSLFANQNACPDPKTLLEEINRLESETLAVLEELSQQVNRPVAVSKSRAEIVEMCLRARQLAQYNSDEPFGAGIEFVLQDSDVGEWSLRVTGVHPASEAFQMGIQRDDLIVAVDGLVIRGLSADGTKEGVVDPNTTMVRGFGGPRNSTLVLTIERDGQCEEVAVTRNIWSARTLGVSNDAPAWDGKP